MFLAEHLRRQPAHTAQRDRLMSFLEFMSVPAILFMVIVAPLWLIFHYKTRWKEREDQRQCRPEDGQGDVGGGAAA